MPEETPSCARTFLSYAHGDQEWLARVKKHLGGLRHQGLIAPFDDRAIPIGAEWDETIKRKLDEFDLIIFLVSADFLDSWYIHKVEIERALKRHDEGRARVLPIIVENCHWERMPFAKVQAFSRPSPDGLVPLSDWGNADKLLLVGIASALWDWVEEFEKQTTAPPTPSTSPATPSAPPEVRGHRSLRPGRARRR